MPPTIIESHTSQVVEANERANLSVVCKASGHPVPSIVWRRDDGAPIALVGRHNRTFNGNTENVSVNAADSVAVAAREYLLLHSNKQSCEFAPKLTDRPQKSSQRGAQRSFDAARRRQVHGGNLRVHGHERHSELSEPSSAGVREM